MVVIMIKMFIKEVNLNILFFVIIFFMVGFIFNEFYNLWRYFLKW